MREGRQGCEGFNVDAYMNRYDDLQQVYGEKKMLYYIHYLRFGYNEGRDGGLE